MLIGAYKAKISSKQMKDTKYFAEEGRNYIKIVHDKSYGRKVFTLSS